MCSQLQGIDVIKTYKGRLTKCFFISSRDWYLLFFTDQREGYLSGATVFVLIYWNQKPRNLETRNLETDLSQQSPAVLVSGTCPEFIEGSKPYKLQPPQSAR